MTVFSIFNFPGHYNIDHELVDFEVRKKNFKLELYFKNQDKMDKQNKLTFPSHLISFISIAYGIVHTVNIRRLCQDILIGHSLSCQEL